METQISTETRNEIRAQLNLPHVGDSELTLAIERALAKDSGINLDKAVRAEVISWRETTCKGDSLRTEAAWKSA